MMSLSFIVSQGGDLPGEVRCLPSEKKHDFQPKVRNKAALSWWPGPRCLSGACKFLASPARSTHISSFAPYPRGSSRNPTDNHHSLVQFFFLAFPYL